MKRDRVALILMLSALAGMLLALSLPAHAADCPPPLSVVDMSWVLTLGSGAVGAGAGGYLMSGRVRTKRRVVGIFALGLGAFGLALLASPIAFGAQESAAPIVVEVPGVPAWVLALSATLGAATSIAMRIVDSWFSAALWRPIVVVLLGAVAVAAPLLARPLDALLTFMMFIGANQAAFGGWRLAAKAKQPSS